MTDNEYVEAEWSKALVNQLAFTKGQLIAEFIINQMGAIDIHADDSFYAMYERDDTRQAFLAGWAYAVSQAYKTGSFDDRNAYNIPGFDND